MGSCNICLIYSLEKKLDIFNNRLVFNSKMKKWLKIILFAIGLMILVYFIYSPPIKIVHFSEINGKISDETGKFIEGADVKVIYSCGQVCFGCFNTGKKFIINKEIQLKTDKDGNFFIPKYNSPLILTFPEKLLECYKWVKSSKEGFLHGSDCVIYNNEDGVSKCSSPNNARRDIDPDAKEIKITMYKPESVY